MADRPTLPFPEPEPWLPPPRRTVASPTVPSAAPPPAGRPRRGRSGLVALWSVLAVFVVCCAGCGAFGLASLVGRDPGQDGAASGARTASPTRAATPTPTRGATASPSVSRSASTVPPAAPRDGVFAFTVGTVRCGVETVGPAWAERRAQGRFCLVPLTVRNVGADARTFLADAQVAFTADGARNRVDGGATFVVNGGGGAWIATVNPGNTITGTLVFDVAPDARLVGLELHDSPFSGGVRVALH